MTNAFTTSAGPGVYRSLSPLVLGSNSPRRRELLGSLGLEFEVCPSNAAEPPPEPGEAPEAYALRMARMKTLDVAVLYPDTVVLGADTIVVLPDHSGPQAILGKPEDAADALRMLTLLSGRAHKVITGCCLALPGQEHEAASHGATAGAGAVLPQQALAQDGEDGLGQGVTVALPQRLVLAKILRQNAVGRRLKL